MTYDEASSLIMRLQMNYAAFMPHHPEAAALKKGMWAEELEKYDFQRGLRAVKDLISMCSYPPTMADLRNYLGAGAEVTRDDMVARLPGPDIEDYESQYSSYTRNKARIDKMMADLDEELKNYSNFA